MARLIDDGRIYWGKDNRSPPRLKQYLSEVQGGLVPKTVWRHDGGVERTDNARKMMKAIFSDVDCPLENPKSVPLIEHIIRIAGDDSAIVLDSFAGLGTTGHAVLNLNEADDGRRRFILVEQEDYADSITAERMRRIIRGVGDGSTHEASFTYFDLGGENAIYALFDGPLPPWRDVASILFSRATGEQAIEQEMQEEIFFAGRSKEYEVYVYYAPNHGYLAKESFTSDVARQLAKPRGKRRRLVFSPNMYISASELKFMQIDFCRLPFDLMAHSTGFAI